MLSLNCSPFLHARSSHNRRGLRTSTPPWSGAEPPCRRRARGGHDGGEEEELNIDPNVLKLRARSARALSRDVVLTGGLNWCRAGLDWLASDKRHALVGARLTRVRRSDVGHRRRRTPFYQRHDPLERTLDFPSEGVSAEATHLSAAEFKEWYPPLVRRRAMTEAGLLKPDSPWKRYTNGGRRTRWTARRRGRRSSRTWSSRQAKCTQF